MLDKFKLQFLIEDFIYYRKKPSIATWVYVKTNWLLNHELTAINHILIMAEFIFPSYS